MLCKLASSHLVRLSLLARKEAVTTLLKVKKNILELTLQNKADFGECKHEVCREPYFYDSAYNFEHLTIKTVANQQGDDNLANTEHSYKPRPLPSPIVVQEDGKCYLFDIQCHVQSSKTPKTEGTRNDRATLLRK